MFTLGDRACQQEIARLDVPMHDAMAMNAIEGRCDLRPQRSHLTGVDWPFGDHVRDRWAGDVLHHQVWTAIPRSVELRWRSS